MTVAGRIGAFFATVIAAFSGVIPYILILFLFPDLVLGLYTQYALNRRTPAKNIRK